MVNSVILGVPKTGITEKIHRFTVHHAPLGIRRRRRSILCF